MIYDTEIRILQLPPGVGTPLQGKLQPVLSAWCGELTVYHSRYWEAVQAGSQVDRMVELPLRRAVAAAMYAQIGDTQYRIEQVQFEKDENDLPVTRLSLRQLEVRYDITGV